MNWIVEGTFYLRPSDKDFEAVKRRIREIHRKLEKAGKGEPEYLYKIQGTLLGLMQAVDSSIRAGDVLRYNPAKDEFLVTLSKVC